MEGGVTRGGGCDTWREGVTRGGGVTIPSSPPEMSANEAMSIPHTDPSCPFHVCDSSSVAMSH